MDGYPKALEHHWDPVIGEPSAIFDPVSRQSLKSRLRVAYSVHDAFKTEALCRLQEEILKFGGSLVVSPVADPDQVAAALAGVLRTEMGDIGPLMPCPGSAGPPSTQIDFPDDFTERQNAVVSFQIVGGHRVRVGHGTVMGVVKEDDELTSPYAFAADRRHKPRIVPFVYKDNVCTVQGAVKIDRLQSIEFGAKERKASSKALKGNLREVRRQIGAAPSVGGLIDCDLVAKGMELAHNTPQEMGIAVVPARRDRMTKENKTHEINPFTV
jgi:hypothetical protein